MFGYFAPRMNEYFNDDRFNTLISNQQERDLIEGESHSNHLTVINPMEVNKLIKSI